VHRRPRATYLAVGILHWSICLSTASVQAQALLGTVDGSNQAIIFPSPGVGLPTPVQIPVTGISGFNQPHGLGFFGPDDALVAGGAGIFVVKVSTQQVVSIIPTAPYYDGTGTLAVAPNHNFALASGGTNQVTVIAAPFGPASQITTAPLPGGVPQQTTQAIVFDPAGRAFIYQDGLSVLDPPYSTVNFTIPIATLNPGRIAITPDGSQVLATTDLGFGVDVFTAPFSSSSVPALIAIPARPGGIVVLPDGTKALVSSDNSTRLFVVSAPYTASSVVEEIPLPSVFNPSADIGVSADGQLAVLAGQGGFTTPDIAFVRGPFTAAGASVFDVKIPGGRGNGAIRFAPAGSVVGLPASSWPMSLLTALGIALTALFLLGRLPISR
jgi:DNA-binding beta-propeller fold protein YncE